MVDFNKILNKSQSVKETDPVKIYSSLDRKSTVGELRTTQNYILKEWYSDRQKDKDLIVKLHTGEGKTLIGLLILLSKLNGTTKPCLYVCPNKYLVEQVCAESDKFGIPYCKVEANGDLPNEFLKGEKILVTYVQKVFNGFSVFGVDKKKVDVECVILDDSHACIDAICSASSMNIKRNESKLYLELLNLFEDDLKNQSEGSYLEIEKGEGTSLMLVPYWSWIKKKSNVLNFLVKYKHDNQVRFAWPFLKDKVEYCNAIVSKTEIEIVPLFNTLKSFHFFSEARQRIVMSATTSDDVFFVKGLEFSEDSINNPLTFKEQKWSGEKMVLLPSLISEELDREFVIQRITRKIQNFGIVILVPSRTRAKEYESSGVTIALPNNIEKEIKDLKEGKYKKGLVIINRYDGIDLPDNACRILVVDSLPSCSLNADKYEEICRRNSDIVNLKIAQKIEQGLGRGVRGEKDFCIILVIGGELVKFMKSVGTSRHFSDQTQKQISIGLEIVRLSKTEISNTTDSFSTISNLINQALSRDSGWKDFYKSEMEKLGETKRLGNVYRILELEKNAENSLIKRNYDDACELIQQIIDNYVTDESERGWYLQQLARYKYFLSESESDKIQKKAFELNQHLLKPKFGINYKKIGSINENRISNVKNYLNKFKDYNELTMHITELLEHLCFGVDSEDFEAALCDIGKLLGFESQRPDKEFRDGPDNLFFSDNSYVFFECKNEVLDGRVSIKKEEAGQMSNACAWFEEKYEKSTRVDRIMVIPTLTLSEQAHLTHEVTIMRKNKLNLFKNNIKSFIKEFREYNLRELSDQKIQTMLSTHKLNISDLKVEYTETYKKNN